MKTNGHRDTLSEDEIMTQRLIGIRRRRRINRMLVAILILIGVMSFWQIYRRNSEIIQMDVIQNVENAEGPRVDMIKGNGDFGTLDDVTREYTHNPSRNNDNGANYTDTTVFPPNKESKDKHKDVQADDKGNLIIDDVEVKETSQHAADRSSQLNIHEDETSTTPVDHEKVKTQKVDKASEENNNNMKPNKEPILDKSSNIVTGVKIEGSISKENQNNTATSKPIDISVYKYQEARYFVSKDGQFELMKFVDENIIVSFSQSFRYSPFSRNDKVFLTLLSQGRIREIYSIKHHQDLRLVAFDAPTLFHDAEPIESCPLCGVIKTTKDINEILAYHVDRILGIERALPATGRKFFQEELDNLGFESANPDDVFPVTWFAKNLIHRGTFQKDQNSMQLSWKQYQEILAECQDTSHLTHVVDCTIINYSDWSRMAVLDFVMQNHDRLDRYCCGYDGDEGEACFHNEILKEITNCDDHDHRFLVHILTSQSNPDELILLDNVGNIHRDPEHLNYEIMKGIKTIPKAVMENIHSEDLKERLTSSLKWDTVYWTSTEDDVIDKLVDTIAQRVEKLKSYIKEQKITTI